MSSDPTKDRCDCWLQVLFTGGCTGKTSLIGRFMFGEFGKIDLVNPGISYKENKTVVDGLSVRFGMWDVPAPERNLSTAQYYVTVVQGVAFVYDISNADSFERVKHDVDFVSKNTRGELCYAIVGNCCDLEDKRQVSREEGEKYAESIGALFFEVSAMTGENVDTLFTKMARDMMMRFAGTSCFETVPRGVLSEDENENIKTKRKRGKKGGCFLQ